MKSLKALLLLAVFCLTVSGSSYDNQPEIKDFDTLKVDKDDFKFSGPVREKGKGKMPDMSELGV